MTTTADLTVLPVSSVPAYFDREHLCSPSATVVAWGVDYRPGDVFEPLPESPRGNPKAWGEWWRTVATTETPDFLGVRPGDTITVHHGGGNILHDCHVISTCRFGAVVRLPWKRPAVNSGEEDAEMYVRRRNHLGHWY